MQVRVFEAENMQSALRQVKQELGPRAIIISTRTVRKGKTGVFNKQKLEVTAALESESGESAATPDANASVGSQQAEAKLAQSVYARHQSTPQVSETETSETAGCGPRRESGSFGRVHAPQGSSMEIIQGELAELRQMVKDLRATGVQAGGSSWDRGSCESQVNSEAQNSIMSSLVRKGIEWEAACKIAARFEERFGEQSSLGSSSLREGINSVLAELVRVRDPLWGDRAGLKKRVALVGPTGVGKTTTVAKLAANYMSKVSPRVALVTVDNYRIAAVEQLKVYAEIMNIPLEVVTAQEEVSAKLAQHEDKDLILVDTAGRSPQDEMSLRELSSYLPPETGVEKHLLLSASTKEQDMQRSIHSFQTLGLNGLVFTKMDECEDYGALFNIHFRNEFPLAYFTTGQKVPEDLMAAEERYLAERIIDQAREASDV